MNNEFKLIGTVTKKSDCWLKDWNVFYDGVNIRIQPQAEPTELTTFNDLSNWSNELQILATNLVAKYNTELSIKQLLSKEGWTNQYDETVMVRKTHEGEVEFDTASRTLSYGVEDICLTFCNDLSPEKIVSQINNIIGDTNWFVSRDKPGFKFLTDMSYAYITYTLYQRESDGCIVFGNNYTVFTLSRNQDFRERVIETLKDIDFEWAEKDLKLIARMATGLDTEVVAFKDGAVLLRKGDTYGFTRVYSLTNGYETYAGMPVIFNSYAWNSKGVLTDWLKELGLLTQPDIEIGSFEGLVSEVHLVLSKGDILFRYDGEHTLVTLEKLSESLLEKAYKVIAKYIQDNVKI